MDGVAGAVFRDTAVSLAAGRRSALWVTAMAGLLLFVDSFIRTQKYLSPPHLRRQIGLSLSISLAALVIGLPVKIMAAADPIDPKKLAYAGASAVEVIMEYFTEFEQN